MASLNVIVMGAVALTSIALLAGALLTTVGGTISAACNSSSPTPRVPSTVFATHARCIEAYCPASGDTWKLNCSVVWFCGESKLTAPVAAPLALQ